MAIASAGSALPGSERQARGERILRAFILAALVWLVLSTGSCAGAPPPVESMMHPGAVENLGSELTTFLWRIESEDGPGQDDEPTFFLLLDLTGFPTLVDEVTRRELVEERVLNRTEYVFAAALPGEPVSVWLGGRFSRFWTAIALSSRGWRRITPGVWHDGAGTRITLYGGGILRIDSGAFNDVRTINSRVAEASQKTSEIVRRPAGRIAALAYVADPPLGQMVGAIDLGALNPRDLVLHVDTGETLDLSFRFAGEREARVVLVTFRFLSPQLLKALDLEAGEGFSLTREDTVVRMSGLHARRETWNTLVEMVIRGEGQ